MKNLHLTFASGESSLLVHRFAVSEAVSSLFTACVWAHSPDPHIDLDTLMGHPAAFHVRAGYRLASLAGARCWSGICCQAEQVQALGPGSGLSMYSLRIVPVLWLLTQRRNYRIFQHLAVPEIVDKLLGEWGIVPAWHADRDAHPRFEYRVQYGESDYDLLCRLLEEAGIAFTFSDEEGDGSALILTDALHLTPARQAPPIPHVDHPNEAPNREYVTQVRFAREVRPGALTLRDHSFRQPALALLGEASQGAPPEARLEQYRYQPGAFLVEMLRSDSTTPAADDRGFARHDAGFGRARATRALGGERLGGRVVAFSTNAIDLRPGTVFSIDDHPRPELDQPLLVTELSAEGTSDGEWKIACRAVPADEPYCPPLRTSKPSAYGVQSAMVVGPPGEEIHTDELGRVRVQFPWDREGQLDDRSSCWVRVSQGWAGAGFGMFALPRVGQEVLVAFLAGDPDQPMIIGRVFNVTNPTPVVLPASKTQSAWRSASTPGGDGFNEIRFDDAKGEELVSVRAQRDLRKLVQRDEAIRIGRDLARTVEGSETARTDGRFVVYVGEDENRVTEGELRERIGGTHSVTAAAHQMRVAGDAALDTVGEIHIKAGTKLVLEAPDVTIKGAGGYLRIDGGGVTTEGGYVRIQPGAGPGAGKGAHPALPLEPARVDAERAPRRLPLVAIPPQRLTPKPVTPEGGSGGLPEATVCMFICQCDMDPAPHKRPSDCLTARLRAFDAASGGTSQIKAEVPYDMSKTPPAPVMSRKEPHRPSTGKHPKGSRAPDVIIVKDPSKPPTQDNIEKVIEVKFPPDRLGTGQADEYKEIAGNAPFEVLGPAECGCPKRGREQEQEQEQEEKVRVDAVAEAALLTLLVLVLILDDSLPGGQVDDAAIPPAIARILSKIGPLLRGLGPVIP